MDNWVFSSCREERFEVSCAYYKGHTGDCINPFLACVDDEYARELKANEHAVFSSSASMICTMSYCPSVQ